MTMTTSSPFMTTSSPFMLGDNFSPSNDLLINHFLKEKIRGKNDEVSRILELDDFYKLDPWELPFLLGINANETEGFFFSPLYAKNSYANNGRINRSTKTGSWQAKGRTYSVKSELTGEEIGMKKVYVHSCIRDGIKWVMHELSARFDVPNQKSLVLCKVIKTPAKTAKTNDQKKKRPYETGKKMKKKAKLPYEGSGVVVLDEDKESCNMESVFEEQNPNEKIDLSTYNKGEEDQKTDNSPCDNEETDWLATIASGYLADKLLGQVNHGMLPSYLQPSPRYNQQDYSPDFSPDQPETPKEQVQGTSLPEPDEDLFCKLDTLWAWDDGTILTYP